MACAIKSASVKTLDQISVITFLLKVSNALLKSTEGRPRSSSSRFERVERTASLQDPDSAITTSRGAKDLAVRTR